MIQMNVPYNRPFTSVLPLVQQPTRQMTVADPDKLDYFARASQIRAGVNSTYGAFSGFGRTGTLCNSCLPRPGMHGLGEAMPAMQTGDANTVQQPGSAQSVGAFFANLGRSVFSAVGASSATPPAPVTPAEQPFPWGMAIAGAAVVGVAGYGLVKLAKKR